MKDTSLQDLCFQLFQYGRQGFSEVDISNYVMIDPGTGGYIREITEIYQSEVLLTDSNFDFGETLSCVTHDGSSEHNETLRHVRFFMNAVALHITASGGDHGGCLSYLIFNLIDDAMWQIDEKLTSLILQIFAELHALLKKSNDDKEERPFLLLGVLLLKNHQEGLTDRSETIARNLIEDESRARNASYGANPPFLFGIDFSKKLCKRWQDLVRKAIPQASGYECVDLVRDQLLSYRAGGLSR